MRKNNMNSHELDKLVQRQVLLKIIDKWERQSDKLVIESLVEYVNNPHYGEV